MTYEPNYGKSRHYNDGIIRVRGNKFVAEFNHAGKRRRKTCATEKKAKEWIDEQYKSVQKHGQTAMKLTSRQVADAVEAFALLKGQASICEAAAFWLLHNKRGGTVSVADLAAEFIQVKIDAGRRDRTIKECRYLLKPLIDAFGGQGVHEISTDMLRDWINSFDTVSAANRAKYLNHARFLFNYAERKELIVKNPLGTGKAWPVGLEPVSGGDEAEIQIMSVGDVEALLHKAEELNTRTAVTLALGFFAGLRTAELHRLKWEQINLKTGIITVSGDVAKKRSRRTIPIEDNLREWLDKYGQKTGLVSLSDARFRAWRRKAVLQSDVEWYKNAARHGYGSFHFAKHKSVELTCYNMGHADSSMFYRHYHGLVTDPADVDLYWAIKPKTDRDT